MEQTRYGNLPMVRLEKPIMEVEIFAICEAATEGGGKLNILGVFDTLFADQAPFVRDTLAVVAKVRLQPTEGGDKRVQIVFLDPDEKELYPPFEVQLKVNTRSQEHTLQTIFRLQLLQFPRFGRYEFVLTVDETRLKSTPLFAKPRTEQVAD